MKVSIIIPAYNEEKRISNTLSSYYEFFKLIKKQKILDFEILIVINNTKDRTEETVRDFCKKKKEIRYLNFKQGGKGFAVIEGFKDALKRENDLIGFVDADMSTSPEAYYDLIANIKNYDGIIASRYISGAKVSPKQSVQRIIASRIFNFMVRSLFLLSYRDTQCGAKLFKRETVKRILPKMGITQWAFDVDLLYLMKKSGKKIKEIPTIWMDKENSKLNLKKSSVQMFFSIIQLRMIYSFFKRFLKVIKPLVKKLYRFLNR
jgi:glycosyltransferase involved in cell wall biosynthesis